MDLLFGLSVVDRMNGDKGARRLYAGWSEGFTWPGRKARRAVAAALVALAVRLEPSIGRATAADGHVATTVPA